MASTEMKIVFLFQRDRDGSGVTKLVLLASQGKETLGNQLVKFSKIPGALSQDILERLLAHANLKEFLESKPVVIHKSCYDSFNEQKYQRAIRRKRSSSDESCDLVNTQPVKTRNQSGPPIEIGQQLCMHCGEPDKFDPKHPHRNKHMKLLAAAGKASSPDHVKEMTEETKMMASVIGDTKLLAQLTNDLRATERFYHAICRANFINR